MTHAELVAAGYELDAQVHARLETYIALLLEANQRVNLTAVRSARQAWVAHVCDSLALLPLIDGSQTQRLCDLGTGGGLPGLPLACARPQLELTLVDATRKKVAAVEQMVAALGLTNVRLVAGRAEALAHELECRERFDGVMARAVAELRMLVEYAAGFVRPGGWCWFFKTPSAARRERVAAARAVQTCGLEEAEAWSYRLPDSSHDRLIVSYRKVAALRADLPRGVGRPRKRPL